VSPSKKQSTFLLCVLLISPATQVMAITLEEALNLAARQEPSFLASKSAIDAANSRVEQNRAAYRPTVNATLNTTFNHRDYTARDSDTPNESTYNSRASQLTITQPLLKSSLKPSLDQARRVLDQSQWQSLSTLNDVITKTTQAWADILIAQSQLQAAIAQDTATAFQLKQFEMALTRGLSSGPVVDDARAKHLQAVAETDLARNEVAIKIILLEQMVGSSQPLSFSNRRSLLNVTSSAAISSCNVTTIETSHPAVLAAKAAIAAARLEITKQGSAHYPTIDIVGNIGRNAQAAGNIPSQPGYAIGQRSVGLQANFPLYAGGSVDAKMREASAALNKSEHELESTLRQVIANHRVAVRAKSGAELKISAATAALVAAKSTLTLENESFNKGLKGEIDRIQAQAKVANAERDIEKAGYEWFIQHTKFLATCGPISSSEISDAFYSQFLPLTSVTKLSGQ
jgi:outer membrane protein